MMDSSENSVRRLAEDRLIKILLETRYDPARCRGTRIEFAYEHLHDELLSLLSEAMDQAQATVLEQNEVLVDLRLKESRSAAYRDAAEIAEETGKNGMPYYGDMHIQIADKLRRKASL